MKSKTASKNKKENLKLSHSMTHYLLVIHDLKESKGYARITDISRALNITKGSVSTTISGLKEKKLVEEEKGSKFLQLSTLGHDTVHQILSNRVLLYSFFKDFLKIKEDSAKKGSCLMEHLIDDEIREKFFYFMKAISLPNENKKKKKLISRIETFETKLDFTKYKNLSDFVHRQESQF